MLGDILAANQAIPPGNKANNAVVKLPKNTNKIISQNLLNFINANNDKGGRAYNNETINKIIGIKMMYLNAFIFQLLNSSSDMSYDLKD